MIDGGQPPVQSITGSGERERASYLSDAGQHMPR